MLADCIRTLFIITITLMSSFSVVLYQPDSLVISPNEANELHPEVRRRIMDIVNGGGLDAEKDIAGAVKSFLYNETKRRPMVFVTLSKT